MDILVGRSNQVQRNEGVEQIVRSRLREIDPLLDIRWVPLAMMDAEGNKWDGRYALTSQWPQADKRWELFQKGEIGEPFDILGWFVEPDAEGNIHNGTRLPVDPLELMDKVLDFLGRGDNSRHPWKDRMKKAIEHNNRIREQQDKAILEETMGAVEYYADLHVGTARGGGADFQPTTQE